MKLYLEYATQLRPLRRAHLLRDENEPKGDCLCNVTINLEAGEIVKWLPADGYLCTNCENVISSAGKRPRFRNPLQFKRT
jgi:hypothetical protein